MLQPGVRSTQRVCCCRPHHATVCQRKLFKLSPAVQYIVIDTLGRGSFGKVKLCLNTGDDMLYAVKVVNTRLVSGRAGAPASRPCRQTSQQRAAAPPLERRLPPVGPSCALPLYGAADAPRPRSPRALRLRSYAPPTRAGCAHGWAARWRRAAALTRAPPPPTCGGRWRSCGRWTTPTC